MLTVTGVNAAKPQAQPYKLHDADGMYLLVSPKGGRYWRMDYRFAGKRKTLALGVFDDVKLAEARKKRDTARAQLRDGIDPGHARRLEKIAKRVAAEETFEAIAEEYLGKLEREGRAERTMKKKRWLLAFAYREIGRRPIAEISAPELLHLLRKVESRGKYESARRLRATCGEVFRFAIASGRAERDVAADLRGALTAPTVQHRAAITEPTAIGELLRAIDGYTGHPVTLAALRLAPLVFVRPGELRHAEWGELDLGAALWTVPAAKMKMKRPHLVPLSRQALEVVADLKPITGHGRFLFPSLRSVKRPISENTLNAALRRLGYAKDEHCAHGFRSTASVRLNEMGCWNPDAIELQLAHQETNAVRRAYLSQAKYLNERRDMMQAWSDYLDGLKQPRVIPLDKSA